jgi:hypothetical protein
MYRHAWFWSLVAVLLVLGGTGWLTAHFVARSPLAGSTECCPPDCYPGCCDACPPDCCTTSQASKDRLEAKANTPANEAGYICPLTGEELPCPSCCPLNQQTSQVSVKKSCCPPCPLCP